MSIRIPLKTVLDYDDGVATSGTGVVSSTAGGVAKQFTLPQDTDNVVVKLTASVLAGGVSVTYQTTDDGGTTWYDVGRTSIVSNANNDKAEWLSIPVISPGVRTFTSIFATGSIQTLVTTPKNTAASSLGINEVSGLPVMGLVNRMFFQYTSAVTSVIAARVRVMANSQANSN